VYKDKLCENKDSLYIGGHILLKKYNISNKELGLFLGITFGLTTIMGIAMGFAYNKVSVDSFPLVQMYYPAMGVIITLLLSRKGKEELPNNFFKTYLFFSITSIIYLLVNVFIFHESADMSLSVWMMIGSFALFIAYTQDSEHTIERFGLKFKNNKKQSIINILLFVFLYLISIFIFSLLTGEVNDFISPFKSVQTWIMLFTLPLSFIFSVMAFLGEEYGWRYFLQPALQERIGKRKGAILLGVIWGLWHLPINMFYYSPETSFYSVLNQLIVCVAYSVFFGYVYMKTKNIWAISMIHFINNNMGHILYKSTGTNLVFTWQALVFNLFLFSIVYMPFLLSKEYGKPRTIEEII
jgi:membrane protease YdiL (CAAX protease family)